MVNEILWGSSKQRLRRQWFCRTFSNDLYESLKQKRIEWKKLKEKKRKREKIKQEEEAKRQAWRQAEKQFEKKQELEIIDRFEYLFKKKMSFSQLLDFFLCFSGCNMLSGKETYKMYGRFFEVYRADAKWYNLYYDNFANDHRARCSLTAGEDAWWWNWTWRRYRLPYNVKDILKIMLSKDLTVSDITYDDISNFFRALDHNKALSQITKSYYKTRFINKFRKIGF